jgi:hypothetical protein
VQIARHVADGAAPAPRVMHTVQLLAAAYAGTLGAG